MSTNDQTPPLIPDTAALAQQLEALRVFMARRFDEISMEINATSQIVGMSEDTMLTRFAEVLSVLNGISYSGDAHTPHNVGLELDAVVRTTEDAANTIIDSATVINSLTKAEIDWADEEARAGVMAEIQDQLATILGACAFQDLAGQRIGRTLENIRAAEDKLSDTLRKFGMQVDAIPRKALQQVEKASHDMASQADVDALFD